MKKIRLLLADDHTILRQGLAALFDAEDDLEVIAQASDGQEAVAQFAQYQPDVSLIDLHMPGMDGYAAIAGIRAIQGNAKILVLTTFEGDEDIYRAFRAGANGYLLKRASAQEVLEAVRQVNAGVRALPAALAVRLSERVSSEAWTSRENEILRLMARGHDNQEIAQQLFISRGTVKGHINHILAKLAVTDRTQAVIVALKRGLARLS